MNSHRLAATSVPQWPDRFSDRTARQAAAARVPAHLHGLRASA